MRPFRDNNLIRPNARRRRRRRRKKKATDDSEKFVSAVTHWPSNTPSISHAVYYIVCKKRDLSREEEKIFE